MRDINLLHPKLIPLAKKFLDECEKSGLLVITTDTWRTKQEQDVLYAKGRTAAGNIVTRAKYPDSMHCWGLAFDFAIKKSDGELAWGLDADTDKDGLKDWSEAGNIAKTLGLEWGGSWTDFKDYPHIQHPDYSIQDLKNRYGTPDNFKQTWLTEEVTPKLYDITAIIGGYKLHAVGTQETLNAVLEAARAKGIEAYAKEKA